MTDYDEQWHQEKFAKHERETETIAIKVDRFRVDGKPTCYAWAGSETTPRMVCKFLGWIRMGTVPVCGMTGDNLHEYQDTSFLEPCADCPLWQDEV